MLEHSDLPIGLRHFIRGIYASAAAVGRAGQDVTFLFFILSGVIQGCPLASFCFVVAFDPFLNLFDEIIEKKGRGIVRVCADDVGMMLSSLDFLPKVASIFRLAHALAGLVIKFKKSCIVLVCRWQDSVRDEFKS